MSGVPVPTEPYERIQKVAQTSRKKHTFRKMWLVAIQVLLAPFGQRQPVLPEHPVE